ncbi:MAG: hypothetical protein PHR51_02795 [Patescibacteria group bacterium]|nr:hypothetical protein [Patescibacteria group bacterium]
MAAQPKKKTSKVRSKTRRAHRHDSIRNDKLWQSGMLPKKERRELFAQYRRRKGLKATTPAETTPKTTSTPAEATAKSTAKPATKKPATKKTTPTKKKE